MTTKDKKNKKTQNQKILTFPGFPGPWEPWLICKNEVPKKLLQRTGFLVHLICVLILIIIKVCSFEIGEKMPKNVLETNSLCDSSYNSDTISPRKHLLQSQESWQKHRMLEMYKRCLKAQLHYFRTEFFCYLIFTEGQFYKLLRLLRKFIPFMVIYK